MHLVREICVFQLQTFKEHEMNRIALIAALLALALTACGQKTQTPAAVAPTVVATTETTSAVVTTSAVAATPAAAVAPAAPAAAMKK
jgi:predicted small lipoprotein YifL